MILEITRKVQIKQNFIPNILEVAAVRKSFCFSFQVVINQVLNLEFPASSPVIMLFSVRLDGKASRWKEPS